MQDVKLTIGFISASDPKNKKNWSGIKSRMLNALEQEFSKVVILGPIRFRDLITVLLFTVDFLTRLVFQKKYNTMHNSLRSKYYGYTIEKKIKNEKIDFLFAPAASVEIAYLKTDIPICYFSDTSFNQIMNYYNTFSHFTPNAIKESNEIEQKAINNSSFQIYSSDWAADHAKSYYKANNASVIKFGANIDNAPERKELVKSYDSTINLLFLGLEWVRKGGDIVFQTIEILDKKGYDFQLYICGCNPKINHPKIQIIPRLNKNRPSDMETFHQLLLKSHLLFLPTRADCTPIVFCEANAYGLPVITTDTGGVSSLIKNDVNGYILPFDAGSNEYAKKIAHLLDNKDKLKDMSKVSRKTYEDELNWEIWAKKMKQTFKVYLEKSGHL
jgi:glycosyltransferase involved in cell wall biosynthesis